ncbi:hypothetical protein Aduo_008249 [Ancylostoma duodenale]
MVSERWHRTLKYTDYPVQDVCGVLDGKLRTKVDSRRHKKAVEEGERGELKRESNCDWLMKSFTTSRRYYRLTVSECPCENTKIHCLLRGICPVRVVCSCPDAVKSGIACKHAHACLSTTTVKSAEVTKGGTEENMPQLEAYTACDDYDTELPAPEADDRDEIEREVEDMDIVYGSSHVRCEQSQSHRFYGASRGPEMAAEQCADHAHSCYRECIACCKGEYQPTG